MKAVVLLAGKGRRLEGHCNVAHKSLILINQKPSLFYLLNNIKKAGIDEIITVVGHNGNELLEEIQNFNFSVNAVWNPKYEITNNLYSLYSAREHLINEDFVIINGDLIFDHRILVDILKSDESQIAIDDTDYDKPIDSPGIILKDNVIADLGRHIPFEDNKGYAIGIYKISKELSADFFEIAEELLNEDLNHGFHDPLRKLFASHNIYPCSTSGNIWTDIDVKEDIEKAERYLLKIMEKNYE